MGSTRSVVFATTACAVSFALGYVARGHPRRLEDIEPTSQKSPPRLHFGLLSPPKLSAPLPAPPSDPPPVLLQEPTPGVGAHDPKPKPRAGGARIAHRTSDVPTSPVAIPSQTVSEEPPPQPDSVDGAAREPDLAAQVDQLKSELDSAQQRQAAQAEDQERRVAARTEALSALQRAGMDLALGDSEVDGELSEAEPALTPFARAAVSAARRSLENDDLFAARQYLQQAIAAETPAGPSGVEASNATPTVGDEAH